MPTGFIDFVENIEKLVWDFDEQAGYAENDFFAKLTVFVRLQGNWEPLYIYHNCRRRVEQHLNDKLK